MSNPETKPPKTPHEIWAEAAIWITLIICLAHILTNNGCAVTFK